MPVSKKEIQMAREADLHSFLCSRHCEAFVTEGRSLRFTGNRSISIKSGYTGYHDFATGEGGNSIDFLVRYLDYPFVKAVTALIPYAPTAAPSAASQPKPAFVLPPVSADFSAAENYLTGRGIERDTLDFLRASNLIYQDFRKNVVFVSKDRNFYEIRGTYPKKAFHQCNRRSPDAYWSFCLVSNPESAFICESSIDAVSLMQIFTTHPDREIAEVGKTSAYCSIAGVANQAAILRIARDFPHVTLAVDNDPAGDACRERNPNLRSIYPKMKDWNEDLLNMKKGRE